MDETAAVIVRRIFQLTMEGKGPYQICTILTNERVPIPAYHQAQQGIGLWKNRQVKDPFAWNSSTITSILEKREYCGDTVNFKTRKHLKDKKSHYVDESQWVVLIRDTLKGIASFAKTDREAFKKSVQEALASQQSDEVKKQKKRLVACKKRHADLEKLLCKIYEDYALGSLPEKRYESMLQTYGREQDNLETEIVELQSTVDKYQSGSSKASSFIKLVERYTDFTELTQVMLHEFIEKVVVHERDRKGAIDSPQTVEIHLNYIGEFMPPVIEKKKLTPKEKAEQEEILKRRERYNRAYQRRT